jgi:phenylpropionate dioxygenase-like ring-hydroxylating dioxygenase large terminal subunit
MDSLRWDICSYPSGWFVVAYSSELSAKEVRPLHYFGRELMLFSDKNSKPALFDAY